ncbi:MAG TPA: tRNA uridine(34) 5-carboxymethylaminomethyl modification radical SAM/GNAT enzyme Elp3 [Candidatus Woesearchaeota archaeon]|nr:tRNA uridine(34) 5-carboxymethylaminomethyl modification radical SAM/GNAT enzyme Elp3 [Candidatus Woesearchaeota archaeon]
MNKEYFSELAERILSGEELSEKKLNNLKIELARKHSVKKLPTNIEILMNADDSMYDVLRKRIITKPTRSLSGVAPCAVMTKPAKCPHGKCIYCPGGVESFFGNVPQSYTGKEPATMRAIRNNFDPYFQVFNRLEQYAVMGHEFQKIELIVMGGTFPALSWQYQKRFVAYCLKALNDFSRLFMRKGKLDIARFRGFFELPGDVGDKDRVKKIHARLRKIKGSALLEKEQEYNDKKSYVNCVGLTIETRPDFGFKEHGLRMLSLGATRVELGVQSISDKTLMLVERGHSVNDTIRSTKELKNLGFKINYHFMLGLPGSSEKHDKEQLLRLFSEPEFKPDMLKIYPTLVTKGTKLYEMWKQGQYRAITNESASRILNEALPKLPRYVRVMRIQRDIPGNVIEAGVTITNIRQVLTDGGIGKRSREIRSREAGRIQKSSEEPQQSEKKEMYCQEYSASGGKEYFISMESQNRSIIFGFCRLRIQEEKSLGTAEKKTALVRELHVYGKASGIGKKEIIQHQGIGKALLGEAEKVSKIKGASGIKVISGIGAREYYRRLGYRKSGSYMAKRFCPAKP